MLLLTLPIFATTFKIQTVDQQIKEADGIFIGHFLKSKSIKLDDGMVATQMVFKMNKEYGLQSELFGIDEIIVHYPGGKVADELVRVEGVPHFVSGEKVALLIKNVDNRFWGLNLGMGSYKIVNYGNETMLINSLFPNDSVVGQISLNNFESSLKNIKEASLKVVQVYQPLDSNNRRPASIDGKNRSLASIQNEIENNTSKPAWSTYWLITILALLGGMVRFFQKKESK